MLTKAFNIICGHYGCGKTNLALNLAIQEARTGKKVSLVDLDLVNPFFRSSEHVKELSEAGVHIIASSYANSNVDVPALPAEINSIFNNDGTVIIDVGGDDVGATVLGRFQSRINALDYDMIYVVNKYRNLTATPEEAAELLTEIEATSRCKASLVVNNSHLKWETTADTILNSLSFAEETAKLCGLPLTTVTVPEELHEEYRERAEKLGRTEKIYPVKIYVRTSWEI